MELKVWCDGIQRVVCGASTTTTCQDIVFALAHATGQTGRFILIEKWRNSERVLAPSDRPLISLTKLGEYASDVTFVMKRSGDVSSQTNKYTNGLTAGQKSDTVLAQNRKMMLGNGQDKPRLPGLAKPILQTMHHSATLPHITRGEPFVRSISFHKPSDRVESSSQYNEMSNGSYDVQARSNYAQLIYTTSSSVLQDKLKLENSIKPSFGHNQEPIYSTVSKNRPPQPPPYKEAITKSTLFAGSAAANAIYGQTSVPISKPTNIVSSQSMGPNICQRISRDFYNQTSLRNVTSETSPSHPKSLSALHHETINLIDMQQQTMKTQEKDIFNIEHELNKVQQILSENELSVKRYQEEMGLLKQLWVEQNMLIEKLEAENLPEDLDRLLAEGSNYESEMKEVKTQLSDCESKVMKCRDQICDMMKQIELAFEDKLTSNGHESEGEAMLQHLRSSLQAKTKEIEAQNCELNSLNASLAVLDTSIKEKNDLIDQLVIEIKDANVEGLSLQSSGLYVEERGAEQQSPHQQASSGDADTASATPSTTATIATFHRTVSNRKISVLPHELANTVPTKKNPSGIWV